MEYLYPKYFYDFQCKAGECEDTCCAGWKIAIDPVSLKKYRKYPGFFGNRLRNSVDWETKSFDQYHRRCALLNDENLCDIYIEAGPGMLCKTCTRYPRHYEEFENLREISLSLSCPAAARMILGDKEKPTFETSFRKTPEEEYERFDFFLFTKLQEIRDFLYERIQDRDQGIELRMAGILAAGHDLQSRIGRKQLYEVDDFLKWCRTKAFQRQADKKFSAYQNHPLEARIQMRRMWRRLYRLEVLKPEWITFLKYQELRLYHDISLEDYQKACREFAGYMKDRETEYEQLLMYFIFVYFCGAVYDENAYGKIKLAVVSTMLIREMGMAVWLENGKTFTLDDQVRIAYRYAREIEHSDPNIEALEAMVTDEDLFRLDRVLKGLLGR